MKSHLVGIVGPCAAGKSTLAARLAAAGYAARHIAQEHSYVKDMWRRLTNPEILIYLQVSYQVTLVRRMLNWNDEDYQAQLDRLQHALEHADLVINTDELSIEEVFNLVKAFLHQRGIEPSRGRASGE